MQHIATIMAYERKDGGFIGKLFVRATKEILASDVLPTLEDARYWAQTKAHEMYDERGYTTAAVRAPGEYRANVWVR